MPSSMAWILGGVTVVSRWLVEGLRRDCSARIRTACGCARPATRRPCARSVQDVPRLQVVIAVPSRPCHGLPRPLMYGSALGDSSLMRTRAREPFPWWTGICNRFRGGQGGVWLRVIPSLLICNRASKERGEVCLVVTLECVVTRSKSLLGRRRIVGDQLNIAEHFHRKVEGRLLPGVSKVGPGARRLRERTFP